MTSTHFIVSLFRALVTFSRFASALQLLFFYRCSDLAKKSNKLNFVDINFSTKSQQIICFDLVPNKYSPIALLTPFFPPNDNKQTKSRYFCNCAEEDDAEQTLAN